MNFANKLTIIRLMLVLPFLTLMGVALSYTQDNLSFTSFNTKTILFITSGIIFTFAMITDYLDGHYARKHQEVTTFGKLFDPIADKFMTSAAFIMIALLKITPFFIPIILILRDIAVDGSRNLAVKHNKNIAANFWGKLKTVVQVLSILILFFVSPAIEPNALYGFNGANGHWQLWLINFSALLAVALSLYSGGVYIYQIIPLIKLSEEEAELD